MMTSHWNLISVCCIAFTSYLNENKIHMNSSDKVIIIPIVTNVCLFPT